MTRQSRTYPTAQFLGLPPDPRRKSPNLMVLGRLGPYGPLEVFCCNGCDDKGRAKPDGSCRHTRAVMDQLKPWWRARARPAMTSQPRSTGAGGR